MIVSGEKVESRFFIAQTAGVVEYTDYFSAES